MQQKREELEARCRDLEEQAPAREAELQRQTEERQGLEAGFSEEREELRRVAAHWNGRWEEVAMKLRLTQGELEEAQREHEQETSTVSSSSQPSNQKGSSTPQTRSPVSC